MSSPIVIELEGHVAHERQGNQFYVPFEVPVGTSEIHAIYSYSHKGNGNNLDFGLYGLDTELNTSEFKGWSGGARDQFTIAYDQATPGYLAGPITAGIWHITFGPYRVLEKEGIDWKLTITMKVEAGSKTVKPFAPTPAPARALTYRKSSPYGNDLSWASSWHRGDLHVHSVHSDGQHEPSELIAAAKARGLDFFFSTEHNTSSAGLVWGKYVPEDFLVGRGEEVTTRYGHWNAIGLEVGQWIDARIPDDESLKKAVAQVHDSDGLSIINHPFDVQLACGWDYSYIDEMDAIEVWNGPWMGHEKDFRNIEAVERWDQYLRDDKIYTAVGASDCHFMPRDTIGSPQTVVNSGDLSVASIIRALRQRKAYIVSQPEYHIRFELVDGDSGEIAETGGVLSRDSNFSVRVLTRGFGASTLHILSNEGAALPPQSLQGDEELILKLSPRSSRKWLRVEIRDLDNNMLGLTNPVWFAKR
jgi:hypothetical protein